MKYSSRIVTSLVVSAMLALGAAGCGSSSSTSTSNTTASTGSVGAGTPNYCQQINDLHNQVTSLSVKDLSSLQTKLTAIQTDVNTIAANAQQDFATQAQAVQTAQQNLSTAVSQLSSNHSISNLTTATKDLASFGTSVQNLYNAAKSTCNK